VNNLANKKAPARATPGFFNQLHNYVELMRLDKPIGVWLLLWPTLWALWLAGEGHPDPGVFVVFMLGVIIMRSAGCVINDYADRDLDPHVARTRGRPIAAGHVSPREALLLFLVLCLLALALALTLNRLTLLLSLAAVPLAVSYPFMKRFTYLPQVHLGIAFGWAVPMAFAAQTNSVPPVAWLILTGVVLWAVAYDTMYAMVDREDDLRIGIKSTAILFDTADKLIIGIIQILLLLCLIMIGNKAELGGLYFTGVVLATGFMIWQQYLIRHRDPASCFKAFLNNNYIGMVLFAGIFLEYQIGGISS